MEGCAIQKLIYENLHGETAVFFHAPWVLCRVRGVGMSSLRVTAAEGAYQQGEDIPGLRREGRTVKATLHLMASSRQEMYRLRSELLGVLSPDKAFDGTRRARLLYENDFGRRWTWAVPESGLDWGERRQNALPSLSLNFRCESPYWYGMTRQEAVFKAKKAGFTLPMKMPLGLGSKSFVCQVDSAGNAEAPAEIAGAIRYANHYQVADLIITGRGGGSMEDLWAFNDERVARAIYASEIPVISAVGHEPDVTISDYVADLRAATPSNAAELAVPDRQELLKKLSMMQTAMQQSVQKTLKLSRQRLNSLAEKRVLQSPLNYVEDRRVLLDFLSTRLHAAGQKTLHEKKQRFVRLTAALDAMSPLKVLSRGYSMVTDETGTLVTSAGAVTTGQRIHVSLRSGSLTAQVEQIQEEDKNV